jgi:hypothetical protein
MGSSGVDEYGDAIPASLGTPVSVSGYLEQRTSVEHLNDRDTVVSQWECYLPAATAVGHLDFINFESQKFQVDGEPAHAYNPRTRQVSHIVCKLVVVNG